MMRVPGAGGRASWPPPGEPCALSEAWHLPLLPLAAWAARAWYEARTEAGAPVLWVPISPLCVQLENEYVRGQVSPLGQGRLQESSLNPVLWKHPSCSAWRLFLPKSPLGSSVLALIRVSRQQTDDLGPWITGREAQCLRHAQPQHLRSQQGGWRELQRHLLTHTFLQPALGQVLG